MSGATRPSTPEKEIYANRAPDHYGEPPHVLPIKLVSAYRQSPCRRGNFVLSKYCPTQYNGSKGHLRLLARNESLEQLFRKLARGLICPCKPIGHPNGHKRKITPGTVTGLVLHPTYVHCKARAAAARTIHWAISVDPRHKCISFLCGNAVPINVRRENSLRGMRSVDECAKMLRGKSNVNTLAVMPLVACATLSAAQRALCSRSR
jgi:hypothetical protein